MYGYDYDVDKNLLAKYNNSGNMVLTPKYVKPADIYRGMRQINRGKSAEMTEELENRGQREDTKITYLKVYSPYSIKVGKLLKAFMFLG